MEITNIRLFQLKNQNLIQQADSTEYTNILKDHIGLHSTDYLTPYISLWARIKSFEPKILFDDLNNFRNVVRLRAFRGTVFVVHKENLKDILGGATYFLASRIEQAKKAGLKVGIDFKSLEQDIDDIFSGNKRLTANEMKKAVAGKVKNEHFVMVHRYLEFKGILTRTNQRYLTDRVIKYGLMAEWIPEINLKKINAEKALNELILKYIKKFGPICLDDLCWWMPLKKTVAKKTLENLKHRLTVFDFNDKEYLMENKNYDSLMRFDTSKYREPIINFLPYEDHFPKAYFVRNWYISKENKPLVFHVGRFEYGQVRPTIWIDGEIIGRWELEWVDKAKSSMKVEIKETVNVSTGISELIEYQRTKLENFVNEKLIPLIKKRLT